ncbi:MAG: hypothetical protein KAG10_05485 [Methylococcales bacterium]|nr:hypothetical protein [Methylococcales bacterium]
MDFIKEDLQTLTGEINDFLELIKFFDKTEKITDESGNIYSINESLKNTLKGKVFLLLYNLIESTLRESITHIHDVLKDEEIHFNQLRHEFRKEILNRAKSDKIGVDNLCKSTALDISTQLLAATFRAKIIFSGNIDHQEVCKQAKIYGLKTGSEYQQTKHGKSLELIKDKRNDLAHGNVSFSEIGKSYSVEQMNEFSQEVINYLESITTHISNALIQKDYLEQKAC